jgi:hypothetical protein
MYFRYLSESLYLESNRLFITGLTMIEGLKRGLFPGTEKNSVTQIRKHPKKPHIQKRRILNTLCFRQGNRIHQFKRFGKLG